MQRSLVLPCVAAVATARGLSNYTVLSDSCYLSQESAAGYRKAAVLGTHEVIVGAGLRSLNRGELKEFRSRAQAGAWLIWERAATFTDQGPQEYDEAFSEIFGVKARSRVAPSTTLYVRYNWPVSMLVRRTGTLPRLSHPTAQVMATCEGEPCGFRQAVGKGGFIYLGSMLGPQIIASDESAETILRHVLSAI